MKRFLNICRGDNGAGTWRILIWRSLTAAMLAVLFLTASAKPVLAENGMRMTAVVLRAETDTAVSVFDSRNLFPGSDDKTNRGISGFTGKTVRKISSAGVKLSKTSYTYDGHAKKPSVTVKYGGKKLKKDRDYTVSYKNNKKRGTASVIIKGKGRYSGTVTKTFRIR